MPITALDGLVIIIILLSAFLAMVRGFSRELLSLASWVLAAVVAWLSYKHTLPYVEPYLSNKTVALAVTVLGLFLVSLLVISIITMKIADLIIDSRIGALDRTLGFVFGLARGVLILAVAMLFTNELIKPEHRPTWISEAKTKPMLDEIGYKIRDALPKDPERVFDKIEQLKKDRHNPDEENATPGDNSDGEQPVE